MDKFKNLFNDFESFFNNDFDSIFNQSFNMIGETKTEKGQDSNGDWVKQNFTSKDGSIRMTTFVRTSGKVSQSKQDISTKIGDLKAELESCVEKQEFEKACELRDKIISLEKNTEKIKSLNIELQNAVKVQNFERAIEIRDELKKLQK